MDGEKFDALLRRVCTTRLTRFSALRGLVAGAAAALTGAALASQSADAKKGGKRKGKGKSSKDRGGRKLTAASGATPTACACSDDLSPKQCPAQSGQFFTCKLCDRIVKGSVQVKCGTASDGSDATCICQPTGNGKGAGCDIRTADGTINIRPGEPVPQCSPVACPKSDCNDNITCTTDRCNQTTGLCEHTPDNSRCNDNDVCTTDVCDPTSPHADPTTGCVHTAINCDDNVFCTVDTCDAVSGCANTPDDSRCDDNDVCTTDACHPGAEGADARGCTHTPISCDDGIACTVDSCDPVSGCAHTPDHGACDDNIACTVDVCDPAAGGCTNTPDHGRCEVRTGCTAVCDPDNPDAEADGCVYVCDECQVSLDCQRNQCCCAEQGHGRPNRCVGIGGCTGSNDAGEADCCAGQNEGGTIPGALICPGT